MAERDVDISSLLDDIRKNPDAVMNYTEDELKSLQNKIFEHGVIKSPTESFAAISLINWRDSYLRKLHFTALVGYLFRLAKEFEYPEEKDNIANTTATKFAEETVQQLWTSFEQFKAENNTSTPVENTTLKKQFMKECADKMVKASAGFVKVEINEFLKRHFEYDPDRHVESAFKENLNDPERAGKFAAMKEKMTTIASDTAVIGEMEVKDKLKSTYQSIISTTEQLRTIVNVLETYKKSEAAKESAIKELAISAALLSNTVKGFAATYGKGEKSLVPDIQAALILTDAHSASLLASRDFLGNGDKPVEVENFSVDDLSGFISKKQIALEDEAKDLYFLDEELLKEVRGPYEWIPSTNVFYHLDRYLTNHYEQIREATRILYNEKADIEFQVQFYGAFDSVQAAQEFERKYESSLITSVFTIQNGGWTLLGPFKENRSRIDFYNKKTEIIKRMFEQAETDQALGKDLMQKRVKRAKKQNILDAGPDDPGLGKYKAAINTIEALGAKEGLSREEKDELAKAYREKEMSEVPEDAIQVDVFGPDADGNFKKSHFYTQSEAPEFMEDRLSEQTNTLKANRSLKAPPKGDSKKVVSRDGKVTSIAELKSVIKPNNLFAE